jgi:putative membrane protein
MSPDLWTPPLGIVGGLIALQVAYWLCTGQYRDRFKGASEPSPRQKFLFAEGVVVLFLALASPLHALSDEYLFTAHMAQHLLLTLVATPLLLAGTPGWLLAELLRVTRTTGFFRWALHPVIAFAGFNLIFMLAHLPPVYEATLGSDATHGAEHIVFLASALLLWLPILSPLPKVLPRYAAPGQIAFFFAQTAPAMLLGGLITGASEPMYSTYAQAVRIVNLTALEDQQLGGLIMWVAGGTYFLAAAAIVFFRWAASEESRNRRPNSGPATPSGAET